MSTLDLIASASVKLAPVRTKAEHHAVKSETAAKIAKSVLTFCKKNVVLLIATLAAAISCIFVPPDAAYADYFDWKTLVSLFCMLAVIAALLNIMFFRILARNIIKVFKTTRASVTALVFITYVASMLIANDMAVPRRCKVNKKRTLWSVLFCCVKSRDKLCRLRKTCTRFVLGFAAYMCRVVGV